MAESITNGNRIRSDPEFDQFYILLHDLAGSCSEYLDRINREDLRVKFGSLPAGVRQRFFYRLLSAGAYDKCEIRLTFMSKFPTADKFFKKLEKHCARNVRYDNNRLMTLLEDFLPLRYKAFCDNNRDAIRQEILSLPDWQYYWYRNSIRDNPSQFGKRFNFFLHCRNISVCSIFSALHEAAARNRECGNDRLMSFLKEFLPLRYKAFCYNNHDVIWEEILSLPDWQYRWYLDSIDDNPSQFGRRFNCFLHCRNISVCSIFSALYKAAGGVASRTLLHPYSSDMGIEHVQGGVGSGIFPYADPGASSSSTAAVRRAYNGTNCTLQCPYSSGGVGSAIFPYADPGASSSSTAAVRRAYNGTNCTLCSPYSFDTGNRHNSPNCQREFTVLSNSLPDSAAHIQSHSPGPAASLNTPVIIQLDGTVIIQLDGTILAEERRATRDDEAAGNAEWFKILVPAGLTVAYEARNILDSINNGSLPFSINTYGYLTVVLAGAAVLSSLVGLSLSTFKPKTLPFGGTPQRMMQIMHNVGVHGIAYGFIGTMCHRFLLDDPFTFWLVAGLASALVMTLVTFIGRRR